MSRVALLSAGVVGALGGALLTLYAPTLITTAERAARALVSRTEQSRHGAVSTRVR